MGTGKRSPLGLPVSDKPPKEVVEGQTGSSRPQSGRAKHMTSRSPQGRSGSSWDTMSPAGCLRAGSRCTNTAPGKAATFSWAQWEIRPLQVRAAGSGNSHVRRSPGPESPAKLQVWVCSQLPQHSDGPHPLTHTPRGSGCSRCAREPDSVLWSQQMGGVSLPFIRGQPGSLGSHVLPSSPGPALRERSLPRLPLRDRL